LKIVLADRPSEIAPSRIAHPDPDPPANVFNLKFRQWFHELARAVDERAFL
jgi:hypothetical protein